MKCAECGLPMSGNWCETCSVPLLKLVTRNETISQKVVICRLHTQCAISAEVHAMKCGTCGLSMYGDWCETCARPAAIKLITRNETISQEVVGILKEHLALAECGDLTAVAIAAVQSDGSAMHQASTNDDNITLLGAVTRLLHRMQVNADSVTE